MKKVIKKQCLGKIRPVVHLHRNYKYFYHPSALRFFLCQPGTVLRLLMPHLVSKRHIVGGFIITPTFQRPFLQFQMLRWVNVFCMWDGCELGKGDRGQTVVGLIVSPSQNHVHLETQKVMFFGNSVFVDVIS